jgi:hypothetical protein
MATPKTAMSEPAHQFVLPAPEGKGTVVYKTHAPTPEQLAVMGIEAAGGIDLQNPLEIMQKLGALFNYLEDVFEKPDAIATIKRRLRDPNDQLTIIGFMESFTAFFEDETGFPTQGEPDSPPSPSTTGKRSTGRIQPGA